MPIQSYAYLLEGLTDAELETLRQIASLLDQKTSVKIAPLKRHLDRLKVEIVVLDPQLILHLVGKLGEQTGKVHGYQAYQAKA